MNRVFLGSALGFFATLFSGQVTQAQHHPHGGGYGVPGGPSYGSPGGGYGSPGWYGNTGNGNGYGRGHVDFVPGHYDAHRGHFDYVPPHYDYHQGRQRYEINPWTGGISPFRHRH